MANGNGATPDPSHVAVAAGLGEQTPILAAILAELRSETAEVAVGDVGGREMVLDKHPVSGCKRIIAYRTGNGTDNKPVPTTGVLLLPANEARMGSTWVNSGTFPVIIYLSDQQRAGVPAVWLGAGGGTWDGRFGDLPWVGNQFAVGQGGTTTLVGGEI